MTAMKRTMSLMMTGIDSTKVSTGNFCYSMIITNGRLTEASGAEAGAIHLKPLRVRFPAANETKFFDVLR